jgi:hypothetical protein
LGAKPEPTQLEHLSDASFLGKCLVLPANVRLNWKGIARYKYLSLFGLNIRDKGKRFYKIVTRVPQTWTRHPDIDKIMFWNHFNHFESFPKCLIHLVQNDGEI